MYRMTSNDRIQLFEDKRIRTAWDEEKEEWYFSVVDVVAVLTDQPDYQAARNYWKVTKKRLKDEGNETVTACNQLKMTASDGKKRLTDVADTEQLLRIIQSIPSPKAEPFKLWLAQVGRDRIEETIDPELTIERALETYLKKGYTREWINQRLQAIQVRKELTDEWDARGVQKGVEYAILTDEISRAWSGMSTRQYKNLKQLLEYGAAVILLDLDETFMFRSSDRIDVVKNRQTCYHLYPEEYGEKLYKILGWEDHGSVGKQTGPCSGDVVLRVSGLTFPGTAPLDLQISGGEIAFLRDENYSTAMQLQSCFLGGQRWLAGSFCLDGTAYTPGELTGLIDTEIGIQIERPDRSNGVLFDNLTGIDNLSISLLSKAGKRIAAGRVKESILDEASQWFPREALQRPLRTWSLPERLRFSYCKWYLLNPKLLICFFPFAGQETAHHEMIIEMLVSCAERGMAVWVISSGIDAICEKTENQEFLRRLRYLNCIL